MDSTLITRPCELAALRISPQRSIWAKCKDARCPSGGARSANHHVRAALAHARGGARANLLGCSVRSRGSSSAFEGVSVRTTMSVRFSSRKSGRPLGGRPEPGQPRHHPSPGAGNLLCAVTHLLDNTGASDPLGGLTGLLNNLL